MRLWMKKAAYSALILGIFMIPGHQLLFDFIDSVAAQSGALGTTVLSNITGNEIVSVAGTGPQIQSVTTNQLRNANNYQLQGAGTTVTVTANANVAKFVVTGAITTLNLTMPPSPADGQTFEVACPGGTASTVAMSANATPSGTTLSGTSFTGCTSGGAAANGAEWIYGLANNIWYRIQ
jgi:hypothetical protein